MKQPKLKKSIDKLASKVEANVSAIENLQSMLHGLVMQQQQVGIPQVLPGGQVVFPNQPNQQIFPPPPVVVEAPEETGMPANDAMVIHEEQLAEANEELHELPEEQEVDIDADDPRPKLDVVMPVQEGRLIPSQVMESITNQGFNTKLWVSTLHSQGDIASARNQVKQYATTDFVLMHDNDIILPDGILERMIKFLENNEMFGAIAVSKKHVPDTELGDVEVVQHVDAGPVMWRRELLEQITYQYRGFCECFAYCEDLRAMGKEVGFLTGVVAQHVNDTRSHILKG